jgi:hypothetical protein
MTYIVPAVLSLWVVLDEPVRHDPKQFILTLIYRICILYTLQYYRGVKAGVFCIHVMKTSHEINVRSVCRYNSAILD